MAPETPADDRAASSASPDRGHHGLLAESVHPRPERTLSFDPAGVDELGVVPWPILLRRRLAARIGIDRRWAVLWVVLGGLFTVSFTVTILVVSLQRIADEFDSSVSVLNWAITGPMLAFGVVGPAFGKAGDLWGHKRVFVTGLLAAGVFAALTALAWSAPTMIAFRILSASAGSACGPSAMAYINRLFEPELRVKPLGYWSFVTAGAPVLGVVAGGPLVEHVGPHVAHKVVDGIQRLVEREGERLGRADADHESTRQPGTARDGDGVNVTKGDAGPVEGLAQGRGERLEVGAGRDLGHDSAVSRVLLHRRCDHVGEQGRAANDPDAGLVAARLDAEHQGRNHACPICGAGIVRRMMIASTPSGW